jgi:hypothetical protein
LTVDRAVVVLAMTLDENSMGEGRKAGKKTLIEKKF